MRDDTVAILPAAAVNDVESYGSINQELVEKTKPKVYKRRWIVLVSFASLSLIQCAIWNTWGPITVSAQLAYNWTDADIALLSNWGPITYIISVLFFTWLMDVKGLRVATLVSTGLVVLGAGLRCISFTPPYAVWLIHVGQILNGFAGPVAMAGPPLLSALWFPVSQRTTATAIAWMLNSSGYAISFIIAPLIVPELNQNLTTPAVSFNYNKTELKVLNLTESNQSIEETRFNIWILMLTELGGVSLLMVSQLIFFPAAPPTAPSVSATVERLDYRNGLKQLVRHKRFWMLGTTYALSGGVYGGWLSVLGVVLKNDFSQIDIGWIGFWASISGSVFCLFISRLSDIFNRHMKLILLLLFLTATVSVLVFCLAAAHIIPMSLVLVYCTNIVAGIAMNGAVPLFFELVCESTYPIAEGVTNGFLTCYNNVTALAFLLVLMIPNIGKFWMNWALLASIALCIPVIIMYKERYGKTNVDLNEKDD